jgi:RHS repeat-associated protein
MVGVEVTNGTTTPLNLTFYNYNDGRFAEIDDNGGGGRTTYISYTNAGQLNWTSGPWGQEAYGYDAAGNRIGDWLTVGSTVTSHNEITWGAANRLADIQDASGNVLRSFAWTDGGAISGDTTTGGNAYVYDYGYRKQLVSVFENGTEVGSYAYDYRNQRVVTVAGSAGTKYVYDESGHLLAEYNAVTGAVAKEYVWLDDVPVAVADYTSGTPIIYYITTGHLNEPQQLIDGSGNVDWNAYINPWGWTGTFSTPSEAINLRLPGQYTQAEANNLSQNHWRDYDPSIGRYIQADPLGIEAGPNVFSYVDNDPYDLTDPRGLDITVGFFGGSATGHLGIGTNGPMSTYGFYPQANSPAYPGIEQPDSGPGSPNPNGPTEWFTIKTTPQQDTAVPDLIAEMRRKPGWWLLSGRNCANIVAEALARAGYWTVPRNDVPWIEFKSLQLYFFIMGK